MHNNDPSNNKGNRPTTWNDLLGPFVRADDLSDDIKKASGLIQMTSSSGTRVCPSFQFETDSSGKSSLNPDVATAWALAKALQIDQLQWSEWSTAAWFTQSRPEHDERSWVDVLKDKSSSDKEKMRIFSFIVLDAAQAATIDGIELIDPRSTLPE